MPQSYNEPDVMTQQLLGPTTIYIVKPVGFHDDAAFTSFFPLLWYTLMSGSKNGRAQLLKEYKVVIYGDNAVGKSALILRSFLGIFTNGELYDPTGDDDETVLVEVVDTAEGEYDSWREQCMRAGEGFILVYSITSRKSFEMISGLYQQIMRLKNQAMVPVVIVGNKCDLEAERQVGQNEGQDIATALGCRFLETSAKVCIGVDEAFSEIAREIRRHKTQQQLTPEGRAQVLTDDHHEGCCSRCIIL